MVGKLQLYEVTRIKRSGETGNRIGIIKAKNQREAARFGMAKGKTKNVRVFKAKFVKSKKRKRLNVYQQKPFMFGSF